MAARRNARILLWLANSDERCTACLSHTDLIGIHLRIGARFDAKCQWTSVLGFLIRARYKNSGSPNFAGHRCDLAVEARASFYRLGVQMKMAKTEIIHRASLDVRISE